MVNCLGEIALFFLFICGRFWRFLPSNTPIMLYSIHYWWFFLSQGNWWTKYILHPKIQSPESCLLMFTSLVILDSFHLLLSTHLTTDLTLKWSGGSMFHPLSHTYVKIPFRCVKTVANNALNRWCIVIFDRLWANAAPTLNRAFSLTNIQAKWWIHCLLTSTTALLSHVTSIYDRPKQVCGIFWCFPGQLPNLGILSIQHHSCLYDHI